MRDEATELEKLPKRLRDLCDVMCVCLRAQLNLFFEFAGRFDPPAFQNATSAALPCVRVAPKVGVQEGGLHEGWS